MIEKLQLFGKEVIMDVPGNLPDLSSSVKHKQPVVWMHHKAESQI